MDHLFFVGLIYTKNPKNPNICPKKTQKFPVSKIQISHFPPNLIKGKKDLVMFLTDEGSWWNLPTQEQGELGTCKNHQRGCWWTGFIDQLLEKIHMRLVRFSCFFWRNKVSKKYLLRGYLDKSYKISLKKKKKDDLWADSHRPSKFLWKDHPWKDLWPNFKSANPFWKPPQNPEHFMAASSDFTPAKCRVHMGDLKATPNEHSGNNTRWPI